MRRKYLVAALLMLPAALQAAPSNGGVTPSSGAGLSQTFSYLFSDSNGFAALSTVYMLINPTLTWSNACYPYYDRVANALWLVSDTGNQVLGPVTPQSNTIVQNSQCILSGTGSSVVGSGNNLTVNVALTFKSAFAGKKNLYMNAQDSGGWSGAQVMGTWFVPAPGNQPPTNISVTPPSGSGWVQTFADLQERICRDEERLHERRGQQRSVEQLAEQLDLDGGGAAVDHQHKLALAQRHIRDVLFPEPGRVRRNAAL
jgi:hypothetical protein